MNLGEKLRQNIIKSESDKEDTVCVIIRTFVEGFIAEVNSRIENGESSVNMLVQLPEISNWIFANFYGELSKNKHSDIWAEFKNRLASEGLRLIVSASFYARANNGRGRIVRLGVVPLESG